MLSSLVFPGVLVWDLELTGALALRAVLGKFGVWCFMSQAWSPMPSSVSRKP